MDTSEKILAAAETLIRECGFHGFSFQDVADRVGIRKASIHHHFAGKAALGAAVIERHRQRMSAGHVALAAATAGGDAAAYEAAFATYLEPILELGRDPKGACLGGVMGAEYLSLPEQMRAGLAAFFEEQDTALASFLGAGRERGVFQFAPDPRAMAEFLFSALEGGLIIKRTTADTAYVERIASLALSLLKAKVPGA